MRVTHPINPIPKLSPATRKTILTTAIVSAIALGGIVGWQQLKRDQSAKIQQAQALLTQACQSDFIASPSALRAAQTQANQGTQLLDNIPNIPILDASAVQKQRISFAGCLQDLKDAQSFFKAQELSSVAFAVNGQTILPVVEWRSREASLQQAIALLQSIQDTAKIHDQAEQSLTLHQAQLTEVRHRIRYEQEAVDAFAQAQNLQWQADRILQSQPNSEQLAEAEAKLQQAINWLKTIPDGHTVSEPSQVRLVEYQDQLAKVQYQYVISHLQPLLQDFKAFAAFADALDVRSEAEFHDYSDRLHTLQSKFYELVREQCKIVGLNGREMSG
jgi:hypothetical protein